MQHRSNSNKVILFLLALFMPTHFLFSQKINSVEVRDLNGDIIPFAWAGGINAPQFSEIDLNNDSVMDLFVFDREGDQVLTFINNGTSGQVDYEYAPEYESKFPEMTKWTFLADYNNDGKNDIFTYNQGGIKVFKNTSSGGNLTFTLKAFPYIESNNGNGGMNNIYVSPVDLPAIVDVDFDGDLDVLSFGLNSDQISYYENFAADSGDIESFKFHDNTYCWGNFREAATTNKIIFNQSCPKFKIKSKGNKHGGATILAFDPDNDQDMDITLGDPTFTNLVFIENGGSSSYANMVGQDTLYPSYNIGVDLQYFPAAFYIDVNNDGLKDLLVAPNTRNGIKNYNGVYYYKNIGNSGNAIFSFQTDDFIQGDMIDLGSFAYPVFFDHNFDGLQDLVVGNGTKYNGVSSISSLSLFENTGTATDPKFKLIDEDYADVSQYNLNLSGNTPTVHLSPAFGDLNSDGTADMLIGDFEGRVHYFQNDPKNGVSDLEFIKANYMGIYKNEFARPFLTGLNGDSLIDLVIGIQNGFLQSYINKGTRQSPFFDSIPDDNKFGDVKTVPWPEFDGYSQPRFYRANNELFMVSGSINGRIYQYNNIENNMSGSFNLLDTFLLNIDVGNRSHVEIGDLNNDGEFDLVIGNSRGGLNIYLTDKSIGIKSQDIPPQDFDFNIKKVGRKNFIILPNKTGSGKITLYGITGMEILTDRISNQYELELNALSNGLYLISLDFEGQKRTKKIIIAE